MCIFREIKTIQSKSYETTFLKQFSQAIRSSREIKRTSVSWISSLLHPRKNPCREFTDV